MRSGNLVTCASKEEKRHSAMQDVGIVENAQALRFTMARLWPVGKLSDEITDFKQIINASGIRSCVPVSLIRIRMSFMQADRINEFEMRIQGKTYMEIMAAGGGIVSSTEAAVRESQR